MPFDIHVGAVLLRRDVRWNDVPPEQRDHGTLTVDGHTYDVRREHTGSGFSYRATMRSKGVAREERLDREVEMSHRFTRLTRMEEGGKHYPYWKDRDHDDSVNKNGRFAIHGGDPHSLRNKIECRHYATLWTLGGFKRAEDGSRAKHEYASGEHHQKIRPFHEAAYAYLIGNGQPHLTQADGVGPYLQQHWNRMRPGETHSFLLETHGHTMAVELERSAADRCTVKLYDPNAETHVRWVAPMAADLAALDLKTFFHPWQLKHYLRGSDALCLTHVDAGLQAVVRGAEAANSVGPLAARQRRRLDAAQAGEWRLRAQSMSGDELGQHLKFLCYANLADDIRSLTDVVRRLPQAERLKAIKPALETALFLGNHASLEAVSELLDTVPKVNRKHGFPHRHDFQRAVMNGRPDVAAAYLELARKHLHGRALVHALDIDTSWRNPNFPGDLRAVAIACSQAIASMDGLPATDRARLCARFDALAAAQARAALP
jgi:hypothetical protein